MTRYLIQLVVDFISPRQLSELDETLAVPCLRLDDALIVLTDTNIMCRVVQNLARGSSESTICNVYSCNAVPMFQHKPVHQGTRTNAVVFIESPIVSSWWTNHTRYRTEFIQVVVAQLLGEDGIYDEELCQQDTIWDQVLARRCRGLGSSSGCGCCCCCGGGGGFRCDDDWVGEGSIQL